MIGGGASPQDCPWHPGQHTRHNCTFNPDGPNWQVPHSGAEDKEEDGTHYPPTAIGGLPSRPNDEAYPPSGIPTGTGFPTSSLGVDYSLLINR